MENSETPPADGGPIVEFEVAIKIDNSGTCTTGMTVSEWNAMTDAERKAIYLKFWDELASRDNGSVTVLTPGAEPV